MIIAIGNVGSTSLKTKIIEMTEDGKTATRGEANLDRIKDHGPSTFACRGAKRGIEKKSVE